MIEGQYLYHVTRRLISDELYIKREVLLEWDEEADHYVIGDSKKPESRTETGFISRWTGSRADTPVEAVNNYVSRSIADNKARVAELHAEITTLLAKNKVLLKLDHSKLKVEGQKDDWVPCDY